jgi:hypothetical protein
MKNIAVSLLFFFTFIQLRAEEGMIIPSLIKAFESDMQAFGMKLTAEDLYAVNQSSIKDAIPFFAAKRLFEKWFLGENFR